MFQNGSVSGTNGGGSATSGSNDFVEEFINDYINNTLYKPSDLNNNSNNNNNNNEEMLVDNTKPSSSSLTDINQHQQQPVEPTSTLISSNTAPIETFTKLGGGGPASSTSSASASYYTLNETLGTSGADLATTHGESGVPKPVTSSLTSSNLNDSSTNPHSYINDFGILASDTSWFVVWSEVLTTTTTITLDACILIN